jgi:hypothetical protein
MLVEPILKNLPVHPCSFLVVIMDRDAVYFGTLEQSWFFGFSNCYKFQFVVYGCIYTTHDRGAFF